MGLSVKLAFLIINMFQVNINQYSETNDFLSFQDQYHLISCDLSDLNQFKEAL